MEKKNILIEIKELEKTILKNLIPSSDILNNKECLLYLPTPTQMQIIEYMIEKENKEVYQKSLEITLNLSRATISDVLQRMEKKGLIKRQIDEKDTRTKKITLEGKAKEMYEEGKTKLTTLEQKAVKDISEKELETFLKVIKQMIDNINN